ncbi:MAG: amidohydrolase [Gammaproteobacteria bacterium]|nr:MAG: amidohydrolase [Gammaproteobacteria bacterium]
MTLSRKIAQFSLIALTLVVAIGSAQAKSLLIINATIYTATNQGVLEHASVLVDNGKIVAVNPTDTPKSDEVFDAQGKILTPGLIGAMSQLGLVEVSAISSTRDARDKKAKITFDPSLAFNPLSTVIPYTRKGGITSSIVGPSGGESIFKGQTFVVDLSAKFDSVIAANTAVVAVIGAKRKGSRAMAIQKLFNTFEDAEKKIAKAKKDKADKADKAKADKVKTAKNKKKAKDAKPAAEPKRDEKIINAMLAGKKSLLVYADRATDILALIKLKKRFKLDLVILDAGDAELVAKQLVAAKVPVVIDAMRDLPGSFDSLHVTLQTAANLINAGVKVAFFNQDTHNMYQLRFDAGNAVANGVSKQAALAAITSNIADIFHLNTGKVAKGQAADLVLWSGDPFELSTHVEKMWIAGDEYSTDARQDKLRNRYLKKSELPTAYNK